MWLLYVISMYVAEEGPYQGMTTCRWDAPLEMSLSGILSTTWALIMASGLGADGETQVGLAQMQVQNTSSLYRYQNNIDSRELDTKLALFEVYMRVIGRLILSSCHFLRLTLSRAESHPPGATAIVSRAILDEVSTYLTFYFLSMMDIG
jgi:hypothetical protein